MKKQCKYCNKTKKLCNAHIVPRNFYLNYKTIKYRSINDKGKYKIWQCGEVDKNILCSDCDNLLGKYDNEVQKLLLQDIEKYLIFRDQNFALYEIESSHYNYEYIRLFFISLIWRASISNLDEFKYISIGKYENIASDILQGKIKDNNDLFKTIILKEPKNKIFNKLYYCIDFNFKDIIAYKFFCGEFMFIIIPDIKNSTYQFNSKEWLELFVNDKKFKILEHEEIYNTKISILHQYQIS